MPVYLEVDFILDILFRRKGKRRFFLRLLITLGIGALLFAGYHYLSEEGQFFDSSDPTIISFEVGGQRFFAKFQGNQAACATLGVSRYQFININNISFIANGVENIKILKKTSEKPQGCHLLSGLEGFQLSRKEMEKYAQ